MPLRWQRKKNNRFCQIAIIFFTKHHRRDAMLRVFSPTGFNINSPLSPGFESGFTEFSGLQRTSSFLV